MQNLKSDKVASWKNQRKSDPPDRFYEKKKCAKHCHRRSSQVFDCLFGFFFVCSFFFYGNQQKIQCKYIVFVIRAHCYRHPKRRVAYVVWITKYVIPWRLQSKQMTDAGINIIGKCKRKRRRRRWIRIKNIIFDCVTDSIVYIIFYLVASSYDLCFYFACI